MLSRFLFLIYSEFTLSGADWKTVALLNFITILAHIYKTTKPAAEYPTQKLKPQVAYPKPTILLLKDVCTYTNDSN